MLLDGTMPGMTGIDVIGQLNQRDFRLPVVMMSGYGESRVEGIGYRGALSFVAKPFTANTLVEDGFRCPPGVRAGGSGITPRRQQFRYCDPS